MASSADEKSEWPIIKEEAMTEFVVQCMKKAGLNDEKPSRLLAELLILADKRGHYSHGVNRLDYYLTEVKLGNCTPTATPQILKETPATAWVEGNNTFGVIVGRFCMDLAIKKAKEVGIGWVVAKGSNHFGIAGYYALMASKHGLVGMTYTNSSPVTVPTRARKVGMGTNPICVMANGAKGDSFELDMATSTVAVGKIEVAQRRGEPIPDGWGCDGEGKQTNDPTECIDHGGCMPLGGTETSGGYKGYGLGMMVELFCGILGGSAFGSNIRKWTGVKQEANLGQCFVALDPGCFAPGFDGRLSQFMSDMKDLERMEGVSEILVPGDPEKRNVANCEDRGGIPYHPRQAEHLMSIGKEYGVPGPL